MLALNHTMTWRCSGFKFQGDDDVFEVMLLQVHCGTLILLAWGLGQASGTQVTSKFLYLITLKVIQIPASSSRKIVWEGY